MENYDLSIESFVKITKQCENKLSKNDYNSIVGDIKIVAKTFHELIERAQNGFYLPNDKARVLLQTLGVINNE